MKQNLKSRKIASHQLTTAEGTVLEMQVVVLEQGYVVSTHPLDEEEANTEWLQGNITLKREAFGIRAYYQDTLLI